MQRDYAFADFYVKPHNETVDIRSKFDTNTDTNVVTRKCYLYVYVST